MNEGKKDVRVTLFLKSKYEEHWGNYRKWKLQTKHAQDNVNRYLLYSNLCYSIKKNSAKK